MEKTAEPPKDEPFGSLAFLRLMKPGQIILYATDLRMTSNVFLAGHKIRLEIAGQDQVQALWYHLPHMANVKHTIYSMEDKPSYLPLPVIPKGCS